MHLIPTPTVLYESQFDAAHDFPYRDAPPRVRYVIASTPRSGSHLLGHALAATGALGFPLEYLHEANFQAWRDRLGTDSARATWRAIERIRTSPNGCFGTKLHFRQLASLPGPLAPADVLGGAEVVRIVRRDLLGQAISLVRARQTGSWIAAQPPKAPPHYDGPAIGAALAELARANAEWDVFLARRGLVPLTVAFEDVVAAPGAAVEAVARHLGIVLPEAGAETSVSSPERQSDAVNADWRRRFLDAAESDATPTPPRPRGRGLVRRILALR